MSKATLRIGVSGHQQIGDEATIEFVSQQLRELLATFQRQAQERGQDILVYSALALGTDQLFVKIALEMGIPLELVIPCSHYAEIFSTTEARDEYHRLLSLCQDVHRKLCTICRASLSSHSHKAAYSKAVWFSL